MNLTNHHLWILAVLVACLLMGSMVICQTTAGTQTLPSPDRMPDDIQYFPAGPEIQLPNARRAIQEYKAAQKGEDAQPYNPSP
ncbi:MAG: hypothetical protein U0929_04750 [Planctomycetaceae bacterium]